MAEIIQFPKLGERDCRIIESSLRATLQSNNMPSEAVDWICKDLKPRYLAGTDNLSFSIEAPIECHAAIQEAANKLISFFHQATTRMMLEMAKLEVELYMAKWNNEKDN